MTEWHESDDFWTEMAPFMFTEERWAGTPAEVDQIEALLDLGGPAAVLDLGCGPGRHALEFARRGYVVTGVDRTAVYLAEARRRARDAGLEVTWIEADLRTFHAGQPFDLVLNLYTAFGYFEPPDQNLAVLRNALEALRPGGRLVLELAGKEILARIFRERSWVQDEAGVIMVEERKVERDWSMMNNLWIKLDGERRQEYRFSHWIYSAAELRAMLGAVGFATVDIYGDMQGRPYDQEATRLVAVARKA